MSWFLRYRNKRFVEQDKGLQERLGRCENVAKRYERVFRGSHGYGFLDWDLLNGKMTWDTHFWEELGYTEADMENISDSEHFLEYVHPDDKASIKNALHAHWRGHGPSEATFRIRKKLGGYIWTEIRVGSVRDENGWVTFMSGIVLDVTKLKQTEQALLVSEARHARIIQSSNDGIWEWSAESGGFHFSNRCWEHLGYKDSDDVVNHGVDRVQAWRKRMHPEDGERFDKALNDHIQNQKPFDVEYRIRGKDDQWRWIRARGQVAYNSKGKPMRMSGTNMDITALKLAEENVLRAKESAEKANEAKSEFLSSMSHELRTPLNAILGFAQLFDLDTNLTADQKINVAEIKKAGELLLELVGDVLDLSKIEANKMDFVKNSILPVRILFECESLLRAQAEEKNIRLTIDTNNNDNVVIQADQVRLKQALINLLTNSIKYNKNDGLIRLSCELTEENRLRISITDTGRGISQQNQKQLFQPFNRLGLERTEIEGSGVGLVITKELVERMGGAIGYKSEENTGSTFWVEFPVAGASEELGSVENAHSVGEYSRPLPELNAKSQKRILYIEDNLSNQRLMTQLLTRYRQVKLDIADEALRGIYMARTEKPDLIILDINLPGMDGYETLTVLRNDPATSQVPIIALTANVLTYDAEKASEAGFDEYLPKPVNLSQLIVVFNRFLTD